MYLPAALLILGTALPGADRLLAVLPVEGGDVLPAARAGIDQALRTGGDVGMPILPRTDIDALLEDAVQAGVRCSLQAVECAVQVGRIAGASDLVIATVRYQPQVELRLVHIDVARGAAVAVAAGIVDGPAGEPPIAVLRRALHPGASIAVDVIGLRGAVTVDGVSFGPAPLVAPVATSSGAHIVAIVDGDTPTGSLLAQRPITAEAGFQRLTVQADAPREETAGKAPTPALVAGGVLAGAGGLTALLGAAMFVLAEGELSTPRSGEDDPVARSEQQAFGQLGAALFVAGAIGGGVGATFILGTNP